MLGQKLARVLGFDWTCSSAASIPSRPSLDCCRHISCTEVAASMSNSPFLPGQQVGPAATDEIARHVADYTVSFLRFTDKGDEDAVVAGSGTLAIVGGVHGILTAGHVLAKLPSEGDVGVVRFPTEAETFQSLRLKMSDCEKLIISSGEFTRTSPDLGFLRLPASASVALESTNKFLDLDAGRSAMSEAEPSDHFFDVVVGAVGVWTNDLPAKLSSTRRKGINGLFGVGKIVKRYEATDVDLFDFKPDERHDELTPPRYNGTSGGGAWRIYLDATSGDEHEPYALKEVRLLGVPFFQFPAPPKGDLVIACQGPAMVYHQLMERVRNRWPSLSGPSDQGGR